jgi:hypothetical protein
VVTLDSGCPIDNMLCMSSTFGREARWYLGNIALFLVLAFAFLVGVGAVTLGTSAEEATIPGRTGAFPVRVLEWALAGMLYLFIWIAPLVLVVVLTAYRAIAAVIHRPRAAAYIVSAAFSTLLVVMAARIPDGDERWIVLPAAGAFVYAAILRLPGQTLTDLPAPVRGFVIGMSLSFVLFLGSLVAIALAVAEARADRTAVAGWILFAGTLLPATLFFADLWRDNVPGLNYLIAAAFVVSAVIGLGLIARSGAPTLLAKYSSSDS